MGALDTIGDALAEAFPGRNPIEQALSLLDGRSPASPYHPVRAAVEAVADTGDWNPAGVAARGVLAPGRIARDGLHYGTTATNIAGGVVSAVPGGLTTFAVLAFLAWAWACFRFIVPPAARVARVEVERRYPVAREARTGRPAPGRPRASTARSHHAGHSGRPTVIHRGPGGVIVCAPAHLPTADSERLAHRRGHTTTLIGTEPCPKTPGRVHHGVQVR